MTKSLTLRRMKSSIHCRAVLVAGQKLSTGFYLQAELLVLNNELIRLSVKKDMKLSVR